MARVATFWFKSLRFAMNNLRASQKAAIVIVLSLAALLLRFYEIGIPFFHFAIDYEYEAAKTARLLYYETSNDIPVARKELAAFNYRMAAKSGPNIATYRPFHFLVVAGYRVFGGERPWIPKSLTAFFWVVGGLFLYGIANKIFSHDAATISLIVYLFHPYAVLSSRSYMVDPVMVMLMLASLFLLWRYFESNSISRLLAASMASSLSILFLPKCLFMLVAVFLLLSLTTRGFTRTFTSVESWIFFGLSVGLPILYYFVLHKEGTHQEQILVWRLYASESFWVGWRHTLTFYVIGYPSQSLIFGRIVLFVALLGVVMAEGPKAKIFLLGLWLGYSIYGLVFTYHIYTHAYYNLPALPTIALSFGAVYCAGMKAMAKFRLPGNISKFVQPATLLAYALPVLLLCQLCLVSVTAIAAEDNGPLNVALVKEAARAVAIGRALNNSTRVISLARFNGQVLMYYGEIGAVGWPSLADFEGLRKIGHPMPGENDAELVWRTYFEGKGYQYFVVTNQDEFRQQPSLVMFLRRYPSCEGVDYLIFDLRSERVPPLRCGATATATHGYSTP